MWSLQRFSAPKSYQPPNPFSPLPTLLLTFIHPLTQSHVQFTFKQQSTTHPYLTTTALQQPQHVSQHQHQTQTQTRQQNPLQPSTNQPPPPPQKTPRLHLTQPRNPPRLHLRPPKKPQRLILHPPKKPILGHRSPNRQPPIRSSMKIKKEEDTVMVCHLCGLGKRYRF